MSFCDQANISQWRAPQAGVKPEKNMEKYSMRQNVCLSCYFELQQAQMEVTVGHIILAVRILKVYYTLFPTERCTLLAASTQTGQ